MASWRAWTSSRFCGGFDASKRASHVDGSERALAMETAKSATTPAVEAET